MIVLLTPPWVGANYPSCLTVRLSRRSAVGFGRYDLGGQSLLLRLNPAFSLSAFCFLRSAFCVLLSAFFHPHPSIVVRD